MRPFEGVKILDCTHVLAGPFSCYQLAVLGADVIKVDDANEPDQSRTNGTDQNLVKMLMGTSFLAQGANKRSIAINIKTEAGRDAFKRLVRDWADVVVDGYRPGSFDALGIGYADLKRIKPKLIYVAMSAYGREGPRGTQTAYDQVIQATSGIMGSTGTETSGPIKVGAPVIDYAHGTTGAFAIAAALYQSLRTGEGQYVDIAMLDVALMFQSSHVTDYLQSGHRTSRRGNKGPRAESSVYETKNGLVQLAANNVRQHRRFFAAIDEPEEAARCSHAERKTRTAEKTAMITRKMLEKTADEWESHLQSKHVPAGRVRELHEALEDPQLKHRGVLHRFDKIPGIDKPVMVPLAAFKFAHGGPSLERAPARLGEHTDEILSAIGFSADEIAALRKSGAVS